MKGVRGDRYQKEIRRKVREAGQGNPTRQTGGAGFLSAKNTSNGALAILRQTPYLN